MSAQAPRPIAPLLTLAAATLLIEAALYVIAARTPPDVTLGVVQKIFYFHVGTAFAMLLTMVTGALLSALDLVSPSDRIDAAARSCIEVGVAFGSMVLISGPLWARKSWGYYWTWEPRLTLTLLVVLLAIAVLLIRGLASDGATGRRIGAALAVLAAPASALIHLAVKLWGGNHPSVLQGGGIQSTEMRIAFWVSVAGLVLFAAALVQTRFRSLRLQQRTAALELDLSAIALRRAGRGQA
ncbi:MAG: cytochrome c biogenesis protein CcsA [Deltaproteobacteria bacterium]|nr:cytochrome c biogenesis protein CcsA [Deltaproteobacteria bacterium]